MKDHDLTWMGGPKGSFKTTIWTQVAEAGGQSSETKRAAIEILMQRYWKPVYCFIRAKNYRNEEAKDLTQGFFALWLETDSFGKADPEKGRFRSYLLTAVSNFLKNDQRGRKAYIRHPKEGSIVSLEALVDPDGVGFEPVDNTSPEDAFHDAWRKNLISSVLEAVQQEWADEDMHEHYALLNEYIVAPILTNSRTPSYEELSQKYSLTKKQISNKLTTGRRAFRRLFMDHINSFAGSSEEVAQEAADVFRFIANTGTP